MGFDQKGTSVFCVKPGAKGQWNVLEEGFDKPLATFDDRDDAVKYAQDIAETKDGSSVKMLDQDGTEERAGSDARGSSRTGDL